MTYDEKKSLYESIMKDIAKIVKDKLNNINNRDKDNETKTLSMQFLLFNQQSIESGFQNKIITLNAENEYDLVKNATFLQNLLFNGLNPTNLVVMNIDHLLYTKMYASLSFNKRINIQNESQIYSTKFFSNNEITNNDDLIDALMDNFDITIEDTDMTKEYLYQKLGLQ